MSVYVWVVVVVVVGLGWILTGDINDSLPLRTMDDRQMEPVPNLTDALASSVTPLPDADSDDDDLDDLIAYRLEKECCCCCCCCCGGGGGGDGGDSGSDEVWVFLQKYLDGFSQTFVFWWLVEIKL